MLFLTNPVIPFTLLFPKLLYHYIDCSRFFQQQYEIYIKKLHFFALYGIMRKAEPLYIVIKDRYESMMKDEYEEVDKKVFRADEMEKAV